MYVFRFALLVLLLMPFAADAAMLYIDPAEGTYGPGDTFIARVRLNTDEECVNAVHVEVDYPKESMRAVDFSRGGSIFSLWVDDPLIDTEQGKVIFAGGIPGGYCGRIQGDPVVSNILGKIVFTVMDASAPTAAVRISSNSRAYLNDGNGTEANLKHQGASFTLVPQATMAENEWLREVGDDVIPPDEFLVEVQSTRDVFGGKYYIVFSTVDKQSGLSHYEIFERGAWKHVESPYQLRDQALRDPLQVRAIDKAGNERMGTYIEGSAPPRQSLQRDYVFAFSVLLILILFGIYRLIHRPPTDISVPPPPSA